MISSAEGSVEDIMGLEKVLQERFPRKKKHAQKA
jgi:hypothetical protein